MKTTLIVLSSLLVLAAVGSQMGFVNFLTERLHKAELEVQKQVRAKAIISQADTLAKLNYDAAVAVGGYNASKSPLFADRYEKIFNQIPKDFKELNKLIAAKDNETENLESVRKILKASGSVMVVTKDHMKNGTPVPKEIYDQMQGNSQALEKALNKLVESSKGIDAEYDLSKKPFKSHCQEIFSIALSTTIIIGIVQAISFSGIVLVGGRKENS